MKSFEQQTYYELLEIPVTATAEEIREAHARAMETYSPDSIAVYTLVEPEQLEALRNRLTEAMEILCEPDLRIEYDRSIGVESSAEPASPQEVQEVEEVVAETAPEPAPSSSGETSAPEPAAWATRSSYILSYAVRGSQFLGTVDGSALLTAIPAAPAPVASEKAPPEETAPAVTPKEEPRAETALPTPAPSAPVAAERRPATPARSGSVPPPLPPRSALRPPVGTKAASPRAPVSPSAPPEREQAPPHPSTEKPPGEAPVLAQGEATAESALAQVPVKAHDSRSRLKTIDLSPDSEFNGEVLRRVRESRNLTVQALSERTRISSRHLENIEADRYEGLPATVYLRGMLMSVARELGLDPLRVSKSYMSLAASSEKRR
ncbi:MAG TPA: helix-turn-helix domain-containing protein [Myxococcaceae bacterium]|nr:helix-turn-helix domain-containing protein [Myxococcaceae bacterium]